MNTLTYGSLFSGIGGIDLGLDRVGMQCKWQVEIDEYATKVLAKHWPNVARFRDIRDCGANNLTSVDLICGGFPCQDISNAGKRAGIDGERSGLWREFYRIICELRPHFVFVENVPALLNGGIDRVLGNLAQSGYDAEWQVLSAAQFGAPHLRKRVFIVAYSNGEYGNRRAKSNDGRSDGFKMGSTSLSNASSTGLEIFRNKRGIRTAPQNRPSTIFERGNSTRIVRSTWWATEPDVGRVANGVPHRVDRLRGLGNAVVPQIAEYIGNCIMNYHQHNVSLVESVG